MIQQLSVCQMKILSTLAPQVNDAIASFTATVHRGGGGLFTYLPG